MDSCVPRQIFECWKIRKWNAWFAGMFVFLGLAALAGLTLLGLLGLLCLLGSLGPWLEHSLRKSHTFAARSCAFD